MEILIIASALFVLSLNVAATVAVRRSPVASPKQQWLQVAIVWLVPVFGAVFIGFFYYTIGRNEAPRASTLCDEQDYPAVNLYPPHGPSDT